MTIHVPPEDIAAGVAGDYRKCPVALAINRHLKEGYFVEVGQMYITIGQYGGPLKDSVDLPRGVTEFITMFDNEYGYPLLPDSLSFDLPIEPYAKETNV